MRRSLLAFPFVFLALPACLWQLEPPVSAPVMSRSSTPSGQPTPLATTTTVSPSGTASQASPTSPAPARVRVPILMYHYIRVNPNPKDSLGFSLSVRPADFQQQMDWLQANGRVPISLEALNDALEKGWPLPAHAVVLTFDDGYADLYSAAFPILRAHRFLAVAYLVTGFLDRPGYLTRAQVRELAGAGVVIGSHTVSHADLTSLGPAELKRQLSASRAELENLAGAPVVDFCYPAGRSNETVAAAVAAAGYRDATTTRAGSEHSLADRLAWTRVRVAGGEAPAQFAAAVSAAS